jgi:hypothetical protein
MEFLSLPRIMVIQHICPLIHRTLPLPNYICKPPPSIPQYLANNSNIEAVDTILQSRQEMLAKVHNKLLKTQARMKHYADLKRRPCTFKVGDLVYVKLP